MSPFQILTICAAVCGYLLGGINGAIILSSKVYKKDIRKYGSGNPGFTNYKRVFGNVFSTWMVLIIDICKTLVPVCVFSILFDKYCAQFQLGACITGFCCMLGHAYPVWYKFKGGKTFIAFATTVWFIDYKMGLVFLAVFFILLFTAKFMSLSSMLAAISCPVSLYFIGFSHIASLIITSMCAILLVWRHKSNIVRLIKREESKFYLFRKNTQKPA